MSSHHFSMIPPPYPDPRKWKEIREFQELHQTTDWMTSKSYDGLLSWSSTVNNTPYQRNLSADDVADTSEEYLSYMKNESRRRPIVEPPRTYPSSDELSVEDSYYDNYNRAENFTDGCNQHNNTNQYGDDVEEVEILQLDDFWIQRLSQTVKRMKQKYNRKQ